MMGGAYFMMSTRKQRKGSTGTLFTFTPSLHEAGKVKLQRRPQNVRDTKTMGHLAKKKFRYQWRWSMKRGWLTELEAWHCQTPLEHRRCHLCLHGAFAPVGFIACLAGLQSCFSLIIPCCSHISPLWKEDVNSVPLHIRSV